MLSPSMARQHGLEVPRVERAARLRSTRSSGWLSLTTTLIAVALAVIQVGARDSAGHRVPDAAVAGATARPAGGPVELTGLGTETSQVFAGRDGTFTQRVTARPTRVRQGGVWVPVDTTVRRLDGAFRPRATSVGLAFSAGGADPLVTLSGDSWSFSLSWPAPLPAPTPAGDRVTYADVLPGVDLVLVAEADGFAERLVVRSRAAARNPALTRIRFVVHTHGITLNAGPDGGVTGVGQDGALVVSAPAPVMWDAGARHGRVALTLRHGVLQLRPDLSMLADPEVRYPLIIDPSFASRRQNWAQVLSASPNAPFWNGQGLNDPADPNGPMMVGLDPAFGGVGRGYFQMDTSAVKGKHIIQAIFQIKERWTRSCAHPTGVQLWETNAVTDSTTWAGPPARRVQLDDATAATGNEGLGCPDSQVEFDATQGVRDAAANNWNTLTLLLMATNESDQWSWKRFDVNPTIAITYNTVPNAPSAPMVEGHGCFTGSSRPFIGTTTPKMTVNVSDPDAGTLLDTSFTWAPIDPPTAAGGTVTQTAVATGSTALVTVPAGKLLDGATYSFRARATDRVDVSAWSAQCEFTVDSTRPAQPPTVGSTDYPPDGEFHGGAGQTAPFTFGANGVGDVTAYRYGWADPPTTQVAAGSPGGAVTIAATPQSSGLNTLYVRSVDRAGNLSDLTRYVFLAGSPDGPVARWTADDGSGASLADVTGNGHTVTLTGGTSWTAGRTAGSDRAVAFDAAAHGYGATAGPVVSTAGSYSVAAWVRLTDTSAYHGVLSQDGAHNSGFQLQFDPTCSCWDLVVPASDAVGATALVAGSSEPVATGTWTHLAAVFDAGAKVLKLYVNGRLMSTAAGPSVPWQASGPFEVGRTKWGDAFGSHFAGDIDDVRAWQRVISATEISRLAGE
ncbi:LamG domain-containing protein [Streptosporangiaceae bacterium NEAU-GS5]|nr:LamG domain-containing protein [Streptosporangiaceae bacterium NEAU-GS5]